jgi:hypothetical protein
LWDRLVQNLKNLKNMAVDLTKAFAMVLLLGCSNLTGWYFKKFSKYSISLSPFSPIHLFEICQENNFPLHQSSPSLPEFPTDLLHRNGKI